MNNLNFAKIESLVVHSVGNKLNDDGCIFSKEPLHIQQEVMTLLTTYFTNSFKLNEFYNLFHEVDINLNEVYSYISKIFKNPELFHNESVNLAKHLYEQSSHSKIKSGEFYVVYFKECVIDGNTIDAVGLFKSENKDTFLKVYPSGNTFQIESQQGVNINKLDKGCIIFNTEADDGYILSVLDNTNKTEAQYWIDEFLHVKQRHDEYFNTQNAMSMYKTFVTKELPKLGATKADQAELINESVKFFKEKETFDFDDFGKEVLREPEIIKSFNEFNNKYQQERDIDISENFSISESAVKKQARTFKSIIKLDKNFHIYVHGNNQYLKRGFDESSGLYYYQLFFQEEQ